MKIFVDVRVGLPRLADGVETRAKRNFAIDNFRRGERRREMAGNYRHLGFGRRTGEHVGGLAVDRVQDANWKRYEETRRGGRRRNILHSERVSMLFSSHSRYNDS